MGELKAKYPDPLLLLFFFWGVGGQKSPSDVQSWVVLWVVLSTSKAEFLAVMFEGDKMVGFPSPPTPSVWKGEAASNQTLEAQGPSLGSDSEDSEWVVKPHPAVGAPGGFRVSGSSDFFFAFKGRMFFYARRVPAVGNEPLAFSACCGTKEPVDKSSLSQQRRSQRRSQRGCVPNKRGIRVSFWSPLKTCLFSAGNETPINHPL